MTRIRHDAYGCLNMILVAVALVALLALAGSAFAQVPCARHDEMVKYLIEKHNEGPVSFGTANGRNIVEVFASAKGTFTIVATESSGLACAIAAGQDWENLGPPPKPGQGT